jgi:hypothetical protein
MALVPKVVQAILGQGRGFDKRFRGVLGRFQGAVPALCFQLVTEPGFLVTQDATVRLVSNGAQFLLTYGVQWSTRRLVQTVVETPTYLAIANKLFSEEERADIVALVAADPECGRPDPWNGWISKGSGRTQRNGEKRWGPSCVYLAQREISSFSYHRFSEE